MIQSFISPPSSHAHSQPPPPTEYSPDMTVRLPPASPRDGTKLRKDRAGSGTAWSRMVSRWCSGEAEEQVCSRQAGLPSRMFTANQARTAVAQTHGNRRYGTPMLTTPKQAVPAAANVAECRLRAWYATRHVPAARHLAAHRRWRRYQCCEASAVSIRVASPLCRQPLAEWSSWQAECAAPRRRHSAFAEPPPERIAERGEPGVASCYAAVAFASCRQPRGTAQMSF